MPRKDGMRTNKEIQVDFTQKSRDIYVAAAERELEAKVPDALKGKPMQYILFSAVRINREPSAIESERLKVTPLSERVAEDLAYNELFKDAPSDTLDHYKAVGHLISHTALSDTVRIGDIIPGNGVEADYTAHTRGSTGMRHASTFKERAAKQSLISAEFFADEVAEYLRSDVSMMPLKDRKVDYIMSRFDGNPSDFPYQIQHNFSLPIEAGVPLNGHESVHYLNALARTMSSAIEQSSKTLSRIEAARAPAVLIESQHNLISRYQKTFEEAQRYLDKK